MIRQAVGIWLIYRLLRSVVMLSDSTFRIVLSNRLMRWRDYDMPNVKNKKSTLCITQKVPVIIIINSNYRYAFMGLIHRLYEQIKLIHSSG